MHLLTDRQRRMHPAVTCKLEAYYHYQECSEAGTFRLFCLRRINTDISEPHPSVQNRKRSDIDVRLYVMSLLHGPSLHVCQTYQMKFGTYKKFGIVWSSATN